jgi:hypothetical protein
VTLVERVQLRRAEEQISGDAPYRPVWGHTGDDVPRARPPDTPKPRPCLAGDCSRKVERWGYCEAHAFRVGLGLDVCGPISGRGRRTKKNAAKSGT